MAISSRMAAVIARVEAIEEAHLAELREKGKADKARMATAKLAATRRAARAVAARKTAQERWVLKKAVAAGGTKRKKRDGRSRGEV
jgi:hypothetical protein